MRGEVIPLLRTSLEQVLFELARDHSGRARSAARQADADQELRHALQAIVLAAACAEAFINWEGRQVFGTAWQRYERGRRGIETRRPSLEAKWIDVPKRHKGKTFDRGKEPFQGFCQLIKLRNYILHHKGGYLPPVPTGAGGVSHARSMINATSANEAVDSTKRMLTGYHRLVGRATPSWIKCPNAGS